MSGPRWLKKSKHGWEQTDRNEDEEQWWYDEDDDRVAWRHKEDQSWYQRQHAWKQKPKRFYRNWNLENFKLPTRVDDVKKLSAATLEGHRALTAKCSMIPKWVNGQPDYGGKWKYRIFEKGAARVLNDEMLEMFFNHCQEIKEEA